MSGGHLPGSAEPGTGHMDVGDLLGARAPDGGGYTGSP